MVDLTDERDDGISRVDKRECQGVARARLFGRCTDQSDCSWPYNDGYALRVDGAVFAGLKSFSAELLGFTIVLGMSERSRVGFRDVAGNPDA